MIVEQKLKDIQTRAAEIEAQMNSGAVSGDELTKLSKEYSRLNEILPMIVEYFQTVAGIKDAEEMMGDAELREIANEQLHELNHRLPEIEKNLQIALLPRDAADDNSVIMEIRAGVGGEESALFAGDLYNQYKLPQRDSDSTAGYDIYLLEDLVIEPNEIKKIPTGIKSFFDKAEVLF